MNTVFPSTAKLNTAFSDELMQDCTLCPRRCHADRAAGQTGYCGQTADIKAARASLHFWEEPCISGTKGSGTVFFSGCNMRCIFCQNHNISMGKAGKTISREHLAEIFLNLQKQGAHNINLVTPTHYIPQIITALYTAKSRGLTVPIVYNSSGYENVDSLRLLDGLVDVYLPDMKYFSSDLSMRFSNAADYFKRACEAILEMYRQTGAAVFAKDGLMRRGIIVRHLVLPGQTKDSKKVLRYLHETYGNNIYISIMSQYTPLPHVADNPELNRRVSVAEYDKVLRFAEQIGIENGFVQEGTAAADSFIPEFDLRGI